MEQLLPYFILFPFCGFLISLLIPRAKEKLLSSVAIAITGIFGLGAAAFTVHWLVNGTPVLDLKFFTLYKTDGFEFFIDFTFDKISAVYLLTGSAIAFIVSFFSRYYIHREEGFKRFFNTILLFFLGYNIVVLGGNPETLFIGWEFLGISSFLLISFYRDRYLPVKNSLKVISIYRLGDVCLMLAMWMAHHLWDGNVTFAGLNHTATVQQHLAGNYGGAAFIAIMFLIAAMTKSAQFPFSSWLPRAMEGPTSSSAIFYGSLSVHLGVFLLLRTYPFWENILPVKIAVIAVGLLTSLIATGIARVQPTVKTQIAYSSVAQIGLIAAETGMGLHYLALIHFAANAFLRTYQLLVSPSVMHYLIHDQFFNYDPAKRKSTNSAFSRIRYSLYILSVKEWNLDHYLNKLLWSPFKFAGRIISRLNSKLLFGFSLLVLLAGIAMYFRNDFISGQVSKHLPVIFSGTGLLIILRAFTERKNPVSSWSLIVISQLIIAITILLNSDIDHEHLLIFLGGIVLSATVGFISLFRIRKLENNVGLDRFHGHVYEHPKLALLFLLSCLGLLGFPVTTTFVGLDLFFTHIHEDQYLLIIFFSLSVGLIELSLLRIYARIFLGQHVKEYHPVAFRSS